MSPRSRNGAFLPRSSTRALMTLTDRTPLTRSGHQERTHMPLIARTLLPPTGSSWIARRWHLYPQLHAARGPSSWRRNRSPVTVPRASGENPGQDDPDAAGVLDLDSGPEMGTSPGSSNGPEPGRRPCPGTPWRSRPPRPRPPGRRRTRLPGASILYLGITLSGERGEGERAHCRRYVRCSW